MTDTTTAPAPINGSKTKATLNGVLTMVALNIIPKIVAYLCTHFPLLNEATWYEVVVLAFGAFATAQVWLTKKNIGDCWKAIISAIVSAIKGLWWGIKQIRSAGEDNAPAVIAIPLLGVLVGCSTIESLLTPSPNVVATMEASLAAADNAAMIYVQLPKCGSQAAGGSKICSDPNIVKSIASAAQNAYIAVKAAEANETASTIQAAQNLIEALQVIVPAIPSK